MRRIALMIVTAAMLAGAATPVRSGYIGVYALIDSVAMEPDETKPERIRVWGSFAFVDGVDGVRAKTPATGAVSPARRGQMYFAMPQQPDSSQVTIRREWQDLKIVAGTNVAVGFGAWRYFGGFGTIDPGNPQSGPVVIAAAPAFAAQGSLLVMPDSARSFKPAFYFVNVGVVRLSPSGSHAAIVARLKAARVQ